MQEGALEGDCLRWAGVCVAQARGVVPGYGQVKLPVTFAPTVDGARLASATAAPLPHQAELR